MTDINKAIKELRDVINGGEGWPTIHRAYDALEQQMINRYGVNNPIDCLRQLDWALTKHATGTFVNVDTYITALQKSLCASPDVVAAAWSVVKNTGPILINEGRVNEVEVYATDKDDIDNLITALEQAVGEGDLTSRIEAAAEEIVTKADEGWPALRCDKCGSLELIRNVPEDGYDCRGCSNFTRTPDEVIGITKIDLEKLATAIIRRHLEVK